MLLATVRRSLTQHPLDLRGSRRALEAAQVFQQRIDELWAIVEFFGHVEADPYPKAQCTLDMEWKQVLLMLTNLAGGDRELIGHLPQPQCPQRLQLLQAEAVVVLQVLPGLASMMARRRWARPTRPSPDSHSPAPSGPRRNMASRMASSSASTTGGASGPKANMAARPHISLLNR